jgi:DNA-binding YbaB/EbfC family protein
MVKNMAEQFQLIQKLQKEMSQLQEALGDMHVEGSAGGGMISVTANGKQEITAIKIDPEVVTPDDVEMLEDLMIAATNQALEKSREMAQDEMQKIAGGMLGNLPGGLKIPGLGL